MISITTGYRKAFAITARKHNCRSPIIVTDTLYYAIVFFDRCI